MEIISIVTLSLSSILLMFVGVMRLSNPINTYLKNSGIKLENDTDLLNEMRGVAAVMLCAGMITLLGIFIGKLLYASHLVASLLFLGFVLGRFVSVKLDGKPNKQIVMGIVFEIVLGIANAVCMIHVLELV